MSKRTFLITLAFLGLIVGVASARNIGPCQPTGEMPCEDHVWYQELICTGPGGQGHVRNYAVGCC